MAKQLQFPLRISTRSLITFKVLTFIGVSLYTIGLAWLFFTDPQDDLLKIVALLAQWASIIVLLVVAFIRFKRYSNVIWNDDHLLVMDKHDIIIPLNEIREVELKTLNGVHEVHLLEEHPYLGESFFFLGSLNYFFRHKKVDLFIQGLNERITEAKREAA
ncbi:MAG: hypothetical protein AAF992_26270 [Bacteroidota bacterium]